MWLFDVSLKKWTEVRLTACDSMSIEMFCYVPVIKLQVTLPDGTPGPPRWDHSTTAISLGQGLVDVTMFGGSPDDLVADQLYKEYSRMSETTVITFGQL